MIDFCRKRAGVAVAGNVYVKYRIVDESLPIVFTFANAYRGDSRCVLSADDVSNCISPWAFDPVAAYGLNVVSFASIGAPSWYRDQELAELIDGLGPQVLRFSERLGYGDSMGAFGVSAFSSRLHLDRLLLVSPISTLNTGIAPFVRGYEWARSTYEWNTGEIDGAKSQSKGVIIYDPLVRGDRLHQQRFSDSFVRLRCPGLGHGLIGPLQRMGLLKPLLRDFVFDDFDLRKTREGFRSCLRGVEDYVGALTRRTEKKKVSRAIVGGLLANRNGGGAAVCEKINYLLHRGDFECAVKLSELFGAHDRHADIFRDFALFIESRDLSSAARAMRFALTLRPHGAHIKKKCLEYKAVMGG